MRTLIFAVLSILVSHGQLLAQQACSSFSYQQQALLNDPSLRNEVSTIEKFIQQKIASRAATTAGRPQGGNVIIKIPVVVHILYNQPGENISDEKVYSQLRVLNESFRRLNADTIKTPNAFKAIAADCEIEFQLATSDPQRRNTTGIIRKYTPVKIWNADDKMKFSAETGSDAWDAKNYLNIWVCNMGRAAGYSSFPGGPAAKDGIVIAFNVFGINTKAGYEMGKTAVHEAGHWMGLRHIWGDAYCGNDNIDDTPTQNTFTSGCPSGIRASSCGTNPNGDMYMNYMDLTLDACTNLFTEGQKERMRATFETGGGRKSILTSYGLLPPLINEIPLPEQLPTWFHPQLYPNPAFNEMTLDLAYDIRWIGKTLRVTNLQGLVVMQLVISSKAQKIDVSHLRPGMYILSGKKDGSEIKQKFIKL
jgi:Pregnancy-associated plasma protein-A/Secretion system C-terminal sorting domain